MLFLFILPPTSVLGTVGFSVDIHLDLSHTPFTLKIRPHLEHDSTSLAYATGPAEIAFVEVMEIKIPKTWKPNVAC
jgi:hypothetical protein